MRASTLLAAAALAAAALIPSSAAAAASSIAGKVSVKPGKSGQGRVVVTSLVDGAVAGVGPISPSGAFKVSAPAGAYAVETFVVPRVGRGKLSTATVPVSLKAGQRRKGIVVKTRAARVVSGKGGKQASAPPPASRSYVQEKGQVTAGVVAISVEDFTGATGDLSVLNAGLPAMLVTDLSGGTQCKTALIANSKDRVHLQKELDLGKSKYFDPKTRVRRNWIVGDLTVNGTLAVAPGGASALATIRITDARTGQTIDTVVREITGATLFDDAAKLGRQLAERLCRRPAGYQLALAVNGAGNFVSHTATGTVESTLTAQPSARDAAQLPSAWSGTATGAWTGLAATPNPGIPCSFAPDGATPITWKADLTVDGDGLRVAFGTTDTAGTTFTAYCPTPNGTAVTPGFKGPTLFGADRGAGTLPLLGGTIPIDITWGEGGIGWTNKGQLTVSPTWANAAG